MPVSTSRRRLSGGIEMQSAGTAHVRVWAPACRRIDLVVEDGPTSPLDRVDDGYFESTLSGLRPGDRYWFRLDGDLLRPDPVSRYQPEGPGGPSAVVDPLAFTWTDRKWGGVGPRGQVLYEMHVGTFTPE